MSTVFRWNPIREIAAIQNAMDRIYHDTRRANWRTYNQMNEESAHALALDIYENDTAYTVVASLPGVNAENIDVKLHEDVLTVQAELPARVGENENTRTLRQERAYGKFSRSVRLADAINSSAVEANFENGVLTLTLPKAEEAQPRLIPVKTINGSN